MKKLNIQTDNLSHSEGEKIKSVVGTIVDLWEKLSGGKPTFGGK